MSYVSPKCLISVGQPIPGTRLQARGEPWTRDPIDQIPRATDLRSAIAALNMMARIISGILRAGPQVNNIKQDSPPDEVEKGQNNDPRFGPKDWIQESRVYRTEKLVNPADEQQAIEIKTLSEVIFYNANTAFRMKYGEP